MLGVGIAGPGAGELIAEGALAIEMGATAKDLALTIHPHPTLSETIMESAEVFLRPLHACVPAAGEVTGAASGSDQPSREFHGVVFLERRGLLPKAIHNVFFGEARAGQDLADHGGDPLIVALGNRLPIAG